MNLNGIINKFRSSSLDDNQLYITIQQDAVYLFNSKGSQQEPLRFPIEHHWDETLDAALSSGDFLNGSATVAFCSGYYQNFQIEKPELPEEEWSSALPFLLKDLISERVTDVVADAMLLPDGRKIQAYVMRKKQVLTLHDKLLKWNVSLNRIVPEDILWSDVQNDIANFMLLYRSLKSDFKIGAYVSGYNRFQRTIRGVVAPLTGNASSDLQLDTIALELQRSIDYLSSQLRDSSINHLLVCCDEEDTDELLTALSERLSVKVLPISQENQWLCGQILCLALKRSSHNRINLFPDSLKPKKVFFTLTNVIGSWLILSAIMLSVYGYVTYENNQDNAMLRQIKSSNVLLNEDLIVLQEQVSRHIPSAEKIAAAERLRSDIKSKKAALKAIGQFDSSLTLGYSGILNALATLAREDISLVDIQVNRRQLSLRGLASKPESVPSWVKQFRTELNLLGRNFEKLSIDRNENDVITFELSTRVDNLSSASTKAGGE